jgi:hypothetical protein
MRIFLGKRFDKWARSEGVADAVLFVAAVEAFAGRYDADLGGFLFKKRIARKDQGKSGGYRSILGFRRNNSERIFLLHGFPKSARANITVAEQAVLSLVAKGLIEATDAQIADLLLLGSLRELTGKDGS